MSGLAAAALPKSSAATAAVIANLRQVISAQSPRGGTVKPPIAIGLSNLDAALHGGLPSGKLVRATRANLTRYDDDGITWGEEVWLTWDDTAGVVLTR